MKKGGANTIIVIATIIIPLLISAWGAIESHRQAHWTKQQVIDSEKINIGT